MLEEAITGGPYAGKTTYARERARKTGADLIHTDDYIELGWSGASERLSDMILELDRPTIMEGVAVPRVLRKYMRKHTDLPVRRVLYLGDCWGKRDRHQRLMTTELERVLAEIEPDLVARGGMVSRRWAGDPEVMRNMSWRDLSR